MNTEKVTPLLGRCPCCDLPPLRLRMLTFEELVFCNDRKLEIGFDDDGKDKHQFHHICWPYDEGRGKGALCGSSRLWGQGGPFENRSFWIDCLACLKRLDAMRLD